MEVVYFNVPKVLQVARHQVGLDIVVAIGLQDIITTALEIIKINVVANIIYIGFIVVVDFEIDNDSKVTVVGIDIEVLLVEVGNLLGNILDIEVAAWLEN